MTELEQLLSYCAQNERVCPMPLALLLMNDELIAPGLDIIVPDITKACPMFFPWSTQSARSATRSSGGSSLRHD